MSNIDSADPPPSLIQEYLRQNGAAQQEGPADVKNPSSLLQSLISTLSAQQQQGTAPDSSLLRSISTDLACLRWLSHALADHKEAEKNKVAEMKQVVDEARLKLENARLEERELREEIRREEAE